MHRSGTSMIGQLLEQTDLFLGVEENRLSADKYNENGYFEDQLITQTNDNILIERAFSGFDITGPDKSNFYGMGWIFAPWVDTTSCVNHDNRISLALDNYLNDDCLDSLAVIKDPRMVFLLDDWKNCIDIEAVIYIHRQPTSVIQSLQKRDKITSTLGGALYTLYNHKCHAVLNDYPSICLSYSAMLDDTANEVIRLSTFLRENNLTHKHIDHEQIVSSKFDHSISIDDTINADYLQSIYRQIQKNECLDRTLVKKFVSLRDTMLCETKQMAESVHLDAVVSQFERLITHPVIGPMTRFLRMIKSDKSFGKIPD